MCSLAEMQQVCDAFLLFVQGGVQFNVVPAQLSVGFDIRFPPMVDVAEFENMLRGWCKDAGDDVALDIVDRVSYSSAMLISAGLCNPINEEFCICLSFC